MDATTSMSLPRDEFKHRRTIKYDVHCLRYFGREFLFLQFLQVVTKCVFAERYDDIGTPIQAAPTEKPTRLAIHVVQDFVDTDVDPSV